MWVDVTKEIMINYFHKSLRTEQELEKRQFKLNINDNIIQESEQLIIGWRIFAILQYLELWKGMTRHCGDS